MQIIEPQAVDTDRASHLMARVRSKQLEAAMKGHVLDSARHAQRAERIGRAVRQTEPSTPSDCSCN